jgi:hypothetical protein
MTEATAVREGFQPQPGRTGIGPPQAKKPAVEYEAPRQAAPKKPVEPEIPPPEIAPSPAEEDEQQANQQATVATFERWPITVRLLHKSIKDDKGNAVDAVQFREPRGGDINRYGNPCRINQDGDVLIEERKMHYMMSALCGILPDYLNQMDPRDWNSCAYRLRNFFLPDPTAW